MLKTMVMKLICIVTIWLFSCFPFLAAFGCVYTVRDVGFVDVGSVPYRLYYYVRDDTPESFTSTFKQISYAALADSNVEIEIVNIDQRKTQPDNVTYDLVMQYPDLWEVDSFPAAILVSPGGQSLVLPISDPDKPFRKTVWSALEDVVISPKRLEILSSIVKASCVVLLVQGRDAAGNEKAERAIADAIDEFRRTMGQTSTSIELPHLVVVAPESLSQEKILLWSLGINRSVGVRSESVYTGPYVAVFYGRGRQIGSLLEGEDITVNEVFSILSAIGLADWCETGSGWVLGKMLPLRWGKEAQSEAAKYLNFDAESPMVRTEISQIISLELSSKGGASAKHAGRGTASLLEEYSEQPLELEEETNVAAVSPAQFHKLVSPGPAASGAGIVSRRVLFTICSMVLLILFGSTFIILRARRKA